MNSLGTMLARPQILAIAVLVTIVGVYLFGFWLRRWMKLRHKA
jgi:hypothetical protein